MLFAVELFPLLSSLSVLAVVVLWFSIQNHKNALLLAIVIPLTLTATIVSYMSVQSILGYPIVKDIEKDSIYVSHITSADDKYIYVWLIEPGSNKPRAVTIPNTDNNKKQMSDAKDSTEKGLKQRMAPHPQEEKLKDQNGGQTQGGEYMIYDFQLKADSLKNYNYNLGLPTPDENQENPGLSYEGEFDTLPAPEASNEATPFTNSTPTNPQPMNYEDLPNLNENETNLDREDPNYNDPDLIDSSGDIGY